MVAFQSDQDLRDFVGGIFEYARDDATLGPQLRDIGGVLKIVTTEPDGALLLDLSTGAVTLGSADDPADATMRMSSGVANRFWQGKVNLPIAMARKQVSVSGSMSAPLRLLPATKKLFPVYVQLLRDAGREDLLA